MTKALKELDRIEMDYLLGILTDTDQSTTSTPTMTPTKTTTAASTTGSSEQMSALSKQEGGNHYKTWKIQPIEYILANNIQWCEANAIKYVSRHRNKNGKEDLLKAIHYIELLIESEYGS